MHHEFSHFWPHRILWPVFLDHQSHCCGETVMVAGHYAAALIPAAHRAKAPFWLLLLCAQIPEFLWLLLAIVGVEPTQPGSILDATFSNIQVNMRFSHNTVPGLIQAVITGIIVLAVYRNLATALWCGALVFAHVLCDYIVGFSHQIMWYASPDIGLNSYATMPYVAVIIELVFALLCVLYYQIKRRDNPMPRGRLIALYLAFAIGVLVWMPAARIPIRAWFGMLTG